MLKTVSKLVACLVLVGGLSNCSWLSRSTVIEKPPQNSFLSTWLPAENFTLHQQIELVYGDNSHTIETLIEFHHKAMNMVLLTQLGQRIASLKYDGHELRVEKSAVVPQAVDALKVLQAFQLSHWPLEALKSSVPDDWVIEQKPGMRLVFKQGVLSAKIVQKDHCDKYLDYLSYQPVFSLHIQSRIVSPQENSDNQVNTNAECIFREYK